jgi:hypothetical protein
LQYVPVAVRRREHPDLPGAALAAFFNDVCLGPNFGCIVCGAANFLTNVVETTSVVDLLSQEGQELFIDRGHIMDNVKMYTQLDSQWVCLGCKKVIESQPLLPEPGPSHAQTPPPPRLPALATRNGLAPTWTTLPASIQFLNHLEMELVALSHVFCQVEGLGHGTEPSKTLYLLLGRAASAPTLADSVREVREVLALHCRPPGHQLQIRLERVLEAWRRLLTTHPRYQVAPGGKEDAAEYLENELLSVLGTEGLVEVLAPAGLAGEQGQAGGPRLGTRHGTVLPWSKPSLPAAARQLLAIPALEAQLAGIMDLQEEAAVARERETPITLQMWAQHRVGHIHRVPASQPGLVLALLQRLDTLQLGPLIARGEAGEAGDQDQWMVRHPGSKPFFDRLKKNISVTRDWHGPPCFFITTSVSTATSDLLGTYVAHLAGMEGRSEQVWPVELERERLKVRPGQQEPPGLGAPGPGGQGQRAATSGPAGDTGDPIGPLGHGAPHSSRVASRTGEEAGVEWGPAGQPAGGRPAGGGTYYVHATSPIEDDSCPFHKFCTRTDLEAWRPRWVLGTSVYYPLKSNRPGTMRL